MAFQIPLSEAASWLSEHQRDDGGWGLAPGQASSMVNTAEALFVLSKAGGFGEACNRGLIYIQTHIEAHLESRGRRSRYVALPLSVIAQCFPAFEPNFQGRLRDILLAGRNADDGWGFDLNDGRSDLFSTYLAVEALRNLGQNSREVAAAGRWVLSRTGASGWPLYAGQSYSIAGTAYAIQILIHSKLTEAPAYGIGRELILATELWDDEDVVIPGTAWLHCRASAVLRALSMSGTDPFHASVAGALRSFNRRMTVGAGWRESEAANSPTIRSQYWAVSALSVVHENFDVSIHVPRVSAERMQGTLVEPNFLPFLTGSHWHFILPARAFRLGVYALFAIGALLAGGIFGVLPSVPNWAARGAGFLLLAAGGLLVNKRPKQFPRTKKVVVFVLAAVGFAGTVWGVSAEDIMALIAGAWAHVHATLWR